MPKQKLEDELKEDWTDAGTKVRPDDKENSLVTDYGDDHL
jgi:hypothetical protein